ncbi:hypothetical protein SLS58_003792 [Diplodia intermedia]|uniref:Uncharacterized protein n=1 Tax=Diplodia intermedia TaxID=856260 RepID=A0ABR3TVI4_9PEZI
MEDEEIARREARREARRDDQGAGNAEPQHTNGEGGASQTHSPTDNHNVEPGDAEADQNDDPADDNNNNVFGPQQAEVEADADADADADQNDDPAEEALNHDSDNDGTIGTRPGPRPATRFSNQLRAVAGMLPPPGSPPESPHETGDDAAAPASPTDDTPIYVQRGDVCQRKDYWEEDREDYRK